MRGIAGIGIACVVLFASRAAVRAAEPAPTATPDQVAVDVANAWQAKDELALATWAGMDEPDPWLVADALMLKGERAAAEAFAKAAPRKDVAMLPDFVTTWSHSAADQAARASLEKMNAAIGSKRYAEALETAAAAPEGAMPFLRLRVAYGGGLALARLGRGADASERQVVVASGLRGIGWLSRSAAALREAAWQARLARRGPQALASAQDLVALETERGSRRGMVFALRLLAAVHGDAGRWDDAHAANTRAVGIAREIGDLEAVAGALNDVAWGAYRRLEIKEMVNAANQSLEVSEPAALFAESARSHAILARAFRNLAKLGGVIKHSEASLVYLRKAGDASSAARAQYVIGRYRGDLGEHELALEPLRGAMAGFEKLGPSLADEGVVARARLAWSLVALGLLDEARPHVEGVRAYAQTSKARLVKGMALRAQARLLRAEGKVADAVTAYREAALLLEADQESTDALLVLVEIAETYAEAKDAAQARAAGDAALRGATEQKDRLALPRAEVAAARTRGPEDGAAALDLARKALENFRVLGEVRATQATEALIKDLEAPRAPR